MLGVILVALLFIIHSCIRQNVWSPAHQGQLFVSSEWKWTHKNHPNSMFLRKYEPVIQSRVPHSVITTEKGLWVKRSERENKDERKKINKKREKKETFLIIVEMSSLLPTNMGLHLAWSVPTMVHLLTDSMLSSSSQLYWLDLSAYSDICCVFHSFL